MLLCSTSAQAPSLQLTPTPKCSVEVPVELVATYAPRMLLSSMTQALGTPPDAPHSIAVASPPVVPGKVLASRTGRQLPTARALTAGSPDAALICEFRTTHGPSRQS